MTPLWIPFLKFSRRLATTVPYYYQFCINRRARSSGRKLPFLHGRVSVVVDKDFRAEVARGRFSECAWDAECFVVPRRAHRALSVDSGRSGRRGCADVDLWQGGGVEAPIGALATPT